MLQQAFAGLHMFKEWLVIPARPAKHADCKLLHNVGLGTR